MGYKRYLLGIFSIVFLNSSSLFSATSVSVDVQGSLNNTFHIEISSGSSPVSLPLSDNYTASTGILAAADYKLVAIDAYSNSAGGYVIRASTSNGYKLENSGEDDAIPYTLEFASPSTTPSNSTLKKASENGDVLINVGANKAFSENKLEGANLMLKSQGLSNFVFSNGTFTDTITLTISSS